MKQATLLFALLFILLLMPTCSRKPIYKVNLNQSVCNATGANTCNWMNNLILANPDKTICLANICLPASHDAGMYLTQYCTAFANTGNTQTQYLPMKQQLDAGLRMFDLRPWYFEHEFYAHHSTHCEGLGCKGDLFKNILLQTKQFLASHQELVILNLTHYCHTSPTDTAFLNLLTRILGDYVYKDTTNSNAELIQIPLKQILASKHGDGKVILMFEGLGNTLENRKRGFFDISLLHTTGGWTNDNYLDNLQEHQRQNFINYVGNGTELYELAWQVTQHDEQALRCALAPNARVALRKSATKANATLPDFIDQLIAKGELRKGKIPNILWDDYADTALTYQCVKINKLNIGN